MCRCLQNAVIRRLLLFGREGGDAREERRQLWRDGSSVWVRGAWLDEGPRVHPAARDTDRKPAQRPLRNHDIDSLSMSIMQKIYKGPQPAPCFVIASYSSLLPPSVACSLAIPPLHPFYQHRCSAAQHPSHRHRRILTKEEDSSNYDVKQPDELLRQG